MKFYKIAFCILLSITLYNNAFARGEKRAAQTTTQTVVSTPYQAATTLTPQKENINAVMHTCKQAALMFDRYCIDASISMACMTAGTYAGHMSNKLLLLGLNGESLTISAANERRWENRFDDNVGQGIGLAFGKWLGDLIISEKHKAQDKIAPYINNFADAGANAAHALVVSTFDHITSFTCACLERGTNILNNSAAKQS